VHYPTDVLAEEDPAVDITAQAAASVAEDLAEENKPFIQSKQSNETKQYYHNNQNRRVGNLLFSRHLARERG